ncbi:homeobox domain-containing protein [Rhizoctonia solani]|nr:homeobox domain-containing protein [Rhizoctonia solani]
MPAEYGLEYAPPPGFVTAFWNPYEVKHRRRTSRAQLGVLETEFDSDPKPNADKRRSLAAQLNMTPRAIQVWFQNRYALQSFFLGGFS